ncbi:hypothetical protein SprV_0200818100 [Sparganum proliferum]
MSRLNLLSEFFTQRSLYCGLLNFALTSIFRGMEVSGWNRPDRLSRCTFNPNGRDTVSPHHHEPLKKPPLIGSSILDLIGNTGLVKINNIVNQDDIKCEVLAKCEFLNPGGSVKDRIAVRMIEEGERAGIFKPGDTLIEPTSGNTGIGLAMAAAVKGYRCIIVLPEKMSKEKCDVLQMLGAELVRTRTSALVDDVDSHIRIAAKIKEELGPNAHIPDQYLNAFNPIAHYDQTAEEILEAVIDCHGKPHVDMVVIGAGTGGTATGIARKFKQRVPHCKVVCVDPVGSNLADDFLGPSPISGPYNVEGIGYDFTPTVFDRSVVDDWVRVDDRDAFEMARRLIRYEGLLCGGSSGSAMAGAFRAIKAAGLGEGHRVVVVLPDSIRNYMTKFLSDEWMFANGYLNFPAAEPFTQPWFASTIDDLINACKLKPAPVVEHNYSVNLAISHTLGKLALVKKFDTVFGVFEPKAALMKLLRGTCNPSDSIAGLCDKEFKKLAGTDASEKLARLLIYFPYVVVEHENDHVLVVASDVLNYSINCMEENDTKASEVKSTAKLTTRK